MARGERGPSTGWDRRGGGPAVALGWLAPSLALEQSWLWVLRVVPVSRAVSHAPGAVPVP